MKKETALEIKNLALAAIENLSSSLNVAMNKCNEDDFEKLKKVVGMSIIKIDDDLLGLLYKYYPELDDLKD